MKRVILLLLALFPAIAFAPPCLAWRGSIVSVRDGDNVLVRCEEDGVVKNIRLYGIDAPEHPWKGRWERQDFSLEAHAYLGELLPVGSLVAVDEKYQDAYRRTVGQIITLPEGRIVQAELLRAGMAWVFPKYCRDCRYWKNIERQARLDGRGLWEDPEPVPPWVWRRRTVKTRQ